MTAPFRDLFVEVPAALLEILRAAVAANLPRAVERDVVAARRPSIATTLACAINNEPLLQQLLERYGWVHVEATRSARGRAIEVVGIRPCRYRDHMVVALVDELALEMIAGDRIYRDVVLCSLDRAARRPCYCVARLDSRTAQR